MADFEIKTKLTYRVAIIKMDDGSIYKKFYPYATINDSPNDADLMLDAIQSNSNCLMRLNGIVDFIVREKGKYYYSTGGTRARIDGKLFEDKLFYLLSSDHMSSVTSATVKIRV